VHQAPNDYFANVFEGHKATQITVGTSATLTDQALRTYNSYFGPAVHFTHMIADYDGHPLESILLLIHVPRDLNSFHQRFGVIVKKLPHLSDEAIAALKRALVRSPDFLPAHTHLAAAYSELGREAEARAEGTEVLRISPNFSLDAWRQILPYKDPAVLERMLAALRKAGMK